MTNDFGAGTTAVLAAITAFIGGVFGWLIQRGKSTSDQNVAVFAEWSKLNKGLADRLAAVEAECSQMRKDHAAEIESIRREHATEMQAMRDRHRTEMRTMRELNEGLQRMIAQNSQSTAHLLSCSPVTTPRDEGDEL